MRHPKRRCRRQAIPARALATLVLVLTMAAAPPALADDAAADEAFRSFERFARDWIGGLQRSGVEGLRFRDVQLEVRATGKRAVPYVGVLRYKEEALKCPPEAARFCEVLKSSAITELFPFEGGRWRH